MPVARHICIRNVENPDQMLKIQRYAEQLRNA